MARAGDIRGNGSQAPIIYLSIDRQRNARYEEACEGTVRAGKVVAITLLLERTWSGK
jgi:hypothetical protein